jgi:hypothetical protein
MAVFLALPAMVSLAQPSAGRMAIQSRFRALQNWTARFELETSADIDPAVRALRTQFGATPASVSKQQSSWREKRAVEFRFLRATAQVRSELSDPDGHALDHGFLMELPYEITMASPERLEHLRRVDDRQRASGDIRERGSNLPEWTLDVALGLRLLDSNEWLRETDLINAQEAQDDQEIELTIKGISGAVSHLRFEKRWGYALVSYRLDYPDPDSFEQIECSEFRVVNGLYIPHHIVRQSTYRDTSGSLRHPFTRTITAQKYVLNDPANVEDSMLIQWPAKAVVLDARTGTRISVGPTSRPLTDAAIAEEIEKRRRSAEAMEQRAKERIDAARGAQPVTTGTPAER